MSHLEKLLGNCFWHESSSLVFSYFWTWFVSTVNWSIFNSIYKSFHIFQFRMYVKSKFPWLNYCCTVCFKRLDLLVLLHLEVVKEESLQKQCNSQSVTPTSAKNVESFQHKCLTKCQQLVGSIFLSLHILIRHYSTADSAFCFPAIWVSLRKWGVQIMYV